MVGTRAGGVNGAATATDCALNSGVGMYADAVEHAKRRAVDMVEERLGMMDDRRDGLYVIAEYKVADINDLSSNLPFRV